MPAEWSAEELLRELGEALDERAGVPAGIAGAGRQLYAWRTVDAELSELVADSAAGAAPALTRDPGGTGASAPAAAGPRSLTFRSARLTIELDLEREPDALRGQLRGTGPDLPRQLAVERVGAEPVTVAVDELGYFAVEEFPLAGVRFRLRAGSVVTPWVD